MAHTDVTDGILLAAVVTVVYWLLHDGVRAIWRRLHR